MKAMNWFDLVPSVMSALASLGSAVAAFWALRISKQAQSASEQSALAIHHGSAAVALSNAVDELKINVENFSDLAYDTWSTWSWEIEKLDHREAGGKNPRPLRHVLTDSSEMLVGHAIGKSHGPRFVHAVRKMFAIIRDGVPSLSEKEYESLLIQADGEYADFSSTFGSPSLREAITHSPAFRWAIYQIQRRISDQELCEFWNGAWKEDGRLKQLQAAHERIKPSLQSVLTMLKSEKAKLAHTVFPLEMNPSLYAKYVRLLDVVEVLSDDCGLNMVEGYSEHAHKNDVAQLIIFSLGVAYLIVELYGDIYQKMECW